MTNINAKILFIQLGCSKNRVDGEQMIYSLSQKGAIMVDNEDLADIIIINTCAFIEDAKKEAIEEILNAVNTGKYVIVTGCLAQRYKDEITKNIPEVAGVLGVFDTDKIAKLVYEVLKGENPSYYNTKGYSYEYTDFNINRVLTTPFYYSYLKIADGCSNGCSYCTIPKIRGKYVSEPMEKLITQAKQMADVGVSELIVIAQDTSRYGLDLYNEKKLVSLLLELEKIDGIRWIRLHYLYPEAITDELLDCIGNSNKILHYFDIPIQHINDRILSLMNRKTNKKEIIKLIKKIRTQIPDAIIRTSLISGFPSETLIEHTELLDFVKKGHFDRLGVFPYSSEEGTKAYKIKGKIPKKEKQRRAKEIMEAQSIVSLKNNKKQKGKILTVLTEGIDTVNNYYIGRSYMDSVEIDNEIYFTSSESVDIGDYVNVQINDFSDYDLIGEMTENV